MSNRHHSATPPDDQHPQGKPAQAPVANNSHGQGKTVAPTGKPDELAPADDGPHPEQPPMSEPQPAKVPPGGGAKRGM